MTQLLEFFPWFLANFWLPALLAFAIIELAIYGSLSLWLLRRLRLRRLIRGATRTTSDS